MEQVQLNLFSVQGRNEIDKAEALMLQDFMLAIAGKTYRQLMAYSMLTFRQFYSITPGRHIGILSLGKEVDKGRKACEPSEYDKLSRMFVFMRNRTIQSIAMEQDPQKKDALTKILAADFTGEQQIHESPNGYELTK